MHERLTPHQLVEMLEQPNSNPFYYVPSLGFISHYDRKKLAKSAGGFVNPFSGLAEEKLKWYHDLLSNYSKEIHLSMYLSLKT